MTFDRLRSRAADTLILGMVLGMILTLAVPPATAVGITESAWAAEATPQTPIQKLLGEYIDAHNAVTKFDKEIEQAKAAKDEAREAALNEQSGPDRVKLFMLRYKVKMEIFSFERSYKNEQNDYKDDYGPAYLEKLNYLNEQAQFFPEAVYDLARSLQFHWEARYAMSFGKKKSERTGLGTKIGAIAGMAILGLLIWRNPSEVPAYFKMVRAGIPLAGAAAGYGIGSAVNASGLFDGKMPPAPAHAMRLGIKSDEYYVGDDAQMRKWLALAAGVAAQTAAYHAIMIGIRVLSTANKAATPAKFNPIVLIASLIIFFAVEKGVKTYLDNREFNKRKDALLVERDRFNGSFANKNDVGLYTAADGIVARSMATVAFLNQPILEASAEYMNDASEAMRDGVKSKFGKKSAEYKAVEDQIAYQKAKGEIEDPENPGAKFLAIEAQAMLTAATADAAKAAVQKDSDYQQELSKLNFKLKRSMDEALEDREYRGEDDVEGFHVRAHLLNRRPELVLEMGDLATARASNLMDHFNRWTTEKERRVGSTLSGDQKEAYFSQYIQAMIDNRDQQLVDELNQGKVYKNPIHVFLQSAALLRSAHKEYLSDHVDDLMSLVARNDMLPDTYKVIDDTEAEVAATQGGSK